MLVLCMYVCVAENAELQIRVNGTSVRNTFLKSNNNNFDRFDMNQTTILNLSAGDYVEIYGRLTADDGSGISIQDTNGNCFGGYRIGT